MRVINLSCEPAKPSPTTMSLKLGDVVVQVSENTTLIQQGKEQLQVPTELLLDPRQSTAMSSFSAKTRFFSKFTTLLRTELNPHMHQTIQQRLVIPKDIYQTVQDVVREHNPAQVRKDAVKVQKFVESIAERILMTLHHPKSAVHDTHTADSSIWAVEQGNTYAMAELQPKTNKLRFSICEDGKGFGGSIRTPEFLKWMKDTVNYEVQVDSIQKAEKETPLEDLFQALQSKRTIAQKPYVYI